MSPADPQPTVGPEPLVRCEGCGRGWHGEIAVHGLEIVGRCPRCSGELSFRPGVGGGGHDPDSAAQWAGDLPPSQILGVTTTWDR